MNGDAPLAPKTVRDAHKILHRALKDAVRWGYVERNVAEMADPPSAKLVNAARKEAIRTWSAEQLLHFLKLMRGDPWFPLWIVAATTGLRRSELLGLGWRDVDLQRGRLAVRQVLVTSDGVPLLEPITKNSNARVVDIDPRVVAILRAHRTDQEAQRRAAGEAWEDHGLVFTRADGHWLNPDYVSHDFVRMNQEAGLPRLRLHDLRHTHASILLAEGEPTKVVQERLGHHSAAFTTDTYQHVTPGMQQRAAQRFVDLVYGPDSTEKQDDEDGQDGAK